MKVCIATPSLSGTACVQFTRSMVDTVKALTMAGMEVQWRVLSFCNFIDAARNQMVREFLMTDYTDLVFIDDDMGWSVDGFMRMLTKDVDVVGAICPRRTDPVQWNANLLRDERGSRIERDGLLECAYVGTGIMRIRRTVLEAMAPPWFDTAWEGGRKIGEDAWFCREWRQRGGRIWAEPDITVTHSGMNEWSGNYRRDSNAY